MAEQPPDATTRHGATTRDGATRAGTSLALGAGAGIVAGLLFAGATGVAPGVVVGAAAGLIIGSARDALLTPSATTTGPRRLELRLRDVLARVWARRLVAVAAAVGIVVFWGVVSGRWMPRGPLTTGQALWSMVLSLAVGSIVGILARSRWVIVAGPVVFAAVYELVRLGTEGPLVDAPRMSTYGLIAFVAGRGVHGVLTLLPLAVGGALGAGAAREIAGAAAPVEDISTAARVGQTARRGITALSVLALVAVAATIARPARTDRITDTTGDVIEGSIAELTTVNVGGHELATMIRGYDTDNPVLLFLAGGPGGSELGAMRRHLSALEEHFTVVTWDQRGTGKSYPALDPTSTLTLESVVADTLAVTDHLRERFDQERIYLLGQSWGSTLGVLAVRAAPDKYVAFVGTGQMVSQRATDAIFYEDTLAWATGSGRSGLAAELRRLGPPPYESVLDYETALSYEHEVYPYDHTSNSEGEGGFSENLFVEEYTLLEQLHLFAGFLDTFAVLYPQLQEIDFRVDATRFEVPVFFVQGEHEAGGRSAVFEEWYPMIEAPLRDVTYLATSGHRPLFEQPDEFVAYMVDTVLTRTGSALPP